MSDQLEPIELRFCGQDGGRLDPAETDVLVCPSGHRYRFRVCELAPCSGWHAEWLTPGCIAPIAEIPPEQVRPNRRDER